VITVAQLQAIMPHARSKAFVYAEPLSDAMDEFEINTPQRQAAFLAQVSHESGQLRYVEELASGAAYEGRADLGNTEPGDGVRFKGRGLIQITGRSNYDRCGSALGLDLLADPELLESPANACRSAAWFWFEHGCNELADADNFRKITLRINGGLNGQPERLAYWELAKEVLA
jgi:putative chitinase